MIETLCQILEEEAERQEAVQALLGQQSEALARRDFDAAMQAAGQLETLAGAAQRAEIARKEYAGAVAAEWGLDPKSTSLKDLAGAAPEACRERLGALQVRLRALTVANAALIQTQGRKLRQGLQTARAALTALLPPEATNYGPQGAACAEAAQTAGLDQRG